MQRYRQSIDTIYRELHSSKHGLSSVDAKEKKQTYGENTLKTKGQTQGALYIFFLQWKSPLIILLVFAGVVSGSLGEYIDSAVILITAFLNVCIGFFQEYKANKALKNLKKLVSYKAVVLRDGKRTIIESQDIVPGDILFLEAGNHIQADGRIIKAKELFIKESVLTGEAEDQKKEVTSIDKEVAIGDRTNMVYRGTIVTNGVGMIIVTATGKDTEIGHIASLVSETKEEPTPLQMQLKKLARNITIVVVFIAIGIVLISVLLQNNEEGLLLAFETAVAVAVAAIPEGLVISLTVILAIGMQFILKRNALVRKLVAAETLGSVSVICTDKTGTLTKGSMQVVEITTITQTYKENEFKGVQDNAALYTALKIGLLCNNAVLEKDGKGIGDTTEVALLQAVEEAALEKEQIEWKEKRIDEIPFDSKRKYMATLHKTEKGEAIYVKGALEKLIPHITYIKGATKKRITKKQIQHIIDQEKEYAQKGLRLLALAYKEDKHGWGNIQEEHIEGLTFAGLVVIKDPLRKDVKETLKVAKKAGIRVMMITGDHAKTAKAIGEELGLITRDGQVLEGVDIENMSDDELKQSITTINIFARVDPKHKLRIVRALQAHDHVVAMTGDGVNDAPAIKAADIGIAVGSGTDVAKSTADMVILDDKFPTIVAAVEEGRGIYENIKKVVTYLLAGSFSEVVLVVGSIVAGLPVAALPAQILWVNIIEDAFPTMALAFEKKEKGLMNEPPRKRNAPIMGKEVRTMIIMKSIIGNIILFAIFVYFYKTTGDIHLTRTIVFVGFAIDALFFIFSVRSLRHMIWQIPMNNFYLIGAVVFGWVMLLLAVYWPPLQILLRTVPLAWYHWVVMIMFGITDIILIEGIKWAFLVRRQKKYNYARK
ncbi:MAG: HAD-IC family P-type ATPase [Candidatus Magasanikbacteria bacterium]|jgi:P-type Ca2+ transporter type 2C|nr:HAD-IC family P-type ATPase [Candidatus Magasanikbacteria bacterium]MBT4221284.1 HAD-IC family P-type ATPase [Candidatus Magasanikbacteria bacterium]MBT4350430.1 HAD-IC family P-type ATPase [Candidatus Magasanikbacteria bacterium]MBT4542023.1 HAD-IC family P-type ATPase [Candidatus Magasanikbacteria bacterium]MBT6253408.1 HAD-IC family P-type ATPase [Candidatus Magasanikbacteria bacterium]